MIVVSDTSAILNLAKIGRLEILRLLYDRVSIPAAVASELADATALADHPWLAIEAARDESRVMQLTGVLDRGEAEAIVLALELRASLLLIDEKRGRRVAEALGLRITGLLGVLAEAKGAGLIEAVRPVLDQLIRDARFWVGSELYDAVLRELDEA